MGYQARAITAPAWAIPYLPSGFEPGGGATGRCLALDPAGDLVRDGAGVGCRLWPAWVAVNLQAAFAARRGCLAGEGLHLVRSARPVGCLGCDLVALLHCCSFAGIQTREGCRPVCWWRSVALRARRRWDRCSAAGDVASWRGCSRVDAQAWECGCSPSRPAPGAC